MKIAKRSTMQACKTFCRLLESTSGMIRGIADTTSRRYWAQYRVPNFSLSICPDSIFSGGRNRSSVSIFAKIANKSFACRRAFWIEFLHEQRRCACLTSLANARVVNSYQFLNFHLLSPSRLPWNSQDHLLRWSPRLFVRIFDSLFVNIFQ